MPFDLKIVFTGLALVCAPGNEPCGNPGKVYLVNAIDGRTICGSQMDGGHQPRLAFDERHLLPGSTQRYDYVPQPGGGKSIIAPLDGIELCVCTAEPGKPPDCHEHQTTTLQRGRAEGQKHPQTWKPDAKAYGWIAGVGETDSRVKDCGYRSEVNLELRDNGDTLTNKYVAARVRLQRGSLSSDDCSHVEFKNGFVRSWKRFSAQDYLLWDVTGKGAESEEEEEEQDTGQRDYPKALPNQIVWTIPNIPTEEIVVLQACGKDDPTKRTLFRLDAAGENEVEVHISNLPGKSVLSTSGPHLEHFRWYYWLVDWDNGKTGCTRCSNSDVVLPTLESDAHKKADAIWGVTSKKVNCPPGDS